MSRNKYSIFIIISFVFKRRQNLSSLMNKGKLCDRRVKKKSLTIKYHPNRNPLNEVERSQNRTNKQKAYYCSKSPKCRLTPKLNPRVETRHESNKALQRSNVHEMRTESQTTPLWRHECHEKGASCWHIKQILLRFYKYTDSLPKYTFWRFVEKHSSLLD